MASRSTVARASALARAPAPAAAAVAPPEFSDFFVMDELDELEVSATTQVATRASLRRRDVATGGATPAPPAPQPRRKKKRMALTYCLLTFFAKAGASRKRRMRRRPMRAAHVPIGTSTVHSTGLQVQYSCTTVPVLPVVVRIY